MVAVLLSVFIVALPSFAAAGISGAFESDDGNLENDGVTDWNDLVTTAGVVPTSDADLTAAGIAREYEVRVDAGNSQQDIIYQGGRQVAKHDVECPGLKTGKALNKGDFVRFGIANEEVNDDTFVYLHWARIGQNSVTASGHASFELNQGETACPQVSHVAETKNVLRTAGDVLFVYDFAGGPDNEPTITLHRWIDAQGNGANGDTGLTATACEVRNALPCWGKGSGDLVAANKADGQVNHVDVGPVFDKIRNTNFNEVEFGEAAINFNEAGIFSDTECTGFGQARVSSRSSGNSFDADLKDWVEPAEVSITNCGSALVNKVDKDDTDTLLAGATFVISPSDIDENDPENTGPNDSNAITMDELDDGVFCTDELFEGTYWVFETEAPDEYELDTTNPRMLSVTADGSVCGTDRIDDEPDLVFENERLRGSILVLKVDENDSPLDGAAFEYAVGDSSDDPDTLTWTALPAVEDETGLFCVDELEFDDYVVRETDAPEGYDAIETIVETPVDEKSDCASRVADDDDPDATYTNSPTPGRVFVTKVDDAGTAMAGIVFELWTAKDDGLGGLEPDTDTGRYCTTDIVGDCYEPDPDDLNATEGFLNVDLGEYCIVEDATSLPAGYDADSNGPWCFEIELTDGGDEVDIDAVNPRTHRIIVLTCHEGSDTLVSSDVTFDGSTKSSIDGTGLTAEQQKALCDLGGATFGDLSGHGDYDGNVDFLTHP